MPIFDQQITKSPTADTFGKPAATPIETPKAPSVKI